MAIQEVNICAGNETPVHIEVVMDNPAGLFQVEKLLARKLTTTGLDRYIGLRACVSPAEGNIRQAIECLVLRDGCFQPETLPTPTHEHWPVDPVCGMTVEPGQEAGVVVYQGVRYHLCSAACLADFRDHPLRYVGTKEKS